MTYILVTGTDTGVGKTIATAALAVISAAAGAVSVVKLAQTGVGRHDLGDVNEVARLSGVTDVYEFVRLEEPLAPETAARRADIALATVTEHADRIAALTATTVLIEGTGGVRVRLDTGGGTVLDLGAALLAYGTVEVVIVTRAGLGTLNHTELTVAAVRDAGLAVRGLVVGSWPVHPDLASRCNREDLPRLTSLPLLAVLPEGCGGWEPETFRAAAPRWFSA
ncbi:dethiobiotin synthase [soil metagenome]